MVRKIRLNMAGNIIEDITDTVLLDGRIKRVSGKNVIIIKDGKIVEAYKDYNLAPIRLSGKETTSRNTENPNIGVIDFETFEYEDHVYKVYAAGFKTYLDNNVTTYYTDNKDSSDVVVLKLVDELLRSKYSKTTFYCHNLGGFDVIFLLKVLVDYNDKHDNKYDLSFKFRDNNILSITISKDKSKLTIKDSYAMFGSSLRKLAEAYDCCYRKSYFPYKFAKGDNLFYVGNTPSINYYEEIPIEDYKLEVKNNWSFQGETLKYLELDLNSLFEILSKANKSLFLDYNTDMTRSLSISGLALNVFLTNYYSKNIPLITQKSMYSDIRQGYYGGITEVYKPFGENLYYYDVNSLYPFAALNDMPGLTCRKILITTNDNIENLFGFFYCIVDATQVTCDYLGLLPLRTDRLIFPLGKWEGWYFSEELKFSIQHGYKITILKGYDFSRNKNVFNSYIHDMYTHKSNATNSTKKSTAKSLLNNLLGRFGIDLQKYETSLLTDDEFESMLHVRDIKGHNLIGSKHLVSYNTGLNYNLISNLGMDLNEVLKSNKDWEIKSQTASSVVISAAVTAYARIIMTQHKLDILRKGGQLYYSDTDSIVTDMQLPDDMVSKTELGKYKLEHKVNNHSG